MFIEEITKIDTLTFAPQVDLKRAKYEKIEIFEDGWQNIVLPNPPANSSRETLQEIKKIQAEYKNASDDDKFAYKMCDEDASYYIKEVLNENGLDYNDDTIEYIEQQCRPVIKHFKNHYNRPRPYQIAEFYGIDLNGTELDSMKTPSYPSGHAVQGYLIGEILSNMDKTNAVLYKGMGEEIAHSRILAKAHYPSDKTYGHKIAMELFKAYK